MATQATSEIQQRDELKQQRVESESDSSVARSDPLLKAMRPQATGRFIVSFDRAATKADREKLLGDIVRVRAGGAKLQVTGLEAFGTLNDKPSSEIRFASLDRFGIAVMDAPRTVAPMAMLQAITSVDGIESARPEYYVYAFESVEDTKESTWGLRATGAFTSPYTGKGVKLAVLDTGIEALHLDFMDRTIVSKSFVVGEDVGDRVGHGTHCAGTAAGPRRRDLSNAGIGYGCAPDVALHIAKVLNNSGVGAEVDAYAGIDWALDCECDVISMSFGRPVQPGTKPDPIYHRLGSQALEEGCLIVAAAGNDSHRVTDFVAPVSIPANAPSILAVGAIDMDLSVASFSNGGCNTRASGVDLVAPGVRVLSSSSVSVPYRILSGTSMACPHVAGVAALWAESNPAYRGHQLWRALVDNARPLLLDASDVGAGLVQAPQGGNATS